MPAPPARYNGWVAEVIVRAERPDDAAAITTVVTAAFPTAAEATLVERLRDADALTGTWVAEHDGTIVGHVAFSPVTIEDNGGKHSTAVGLGPVAVAPTQQRRGVGVALIEHGLAQLHRDGHALVVVLGSPAYYPRFGFVRADLHGIGWEHEAPPEAFMVRELVHGAATSQPGIVRYHPAFADCG